MAITKQDVWQVANEINAEGLKPSVVEVRRRLGSGSYTTITAALKEWVEPGSEDLEQIPVPNEFQERVSQAGADLFELAMKIANEQLQKEREAWAVEREQLEAERNEAIRLADALANDLDLAKVQAEEKADSMKDEVELLRAGRDQEHRRTCTTPVNAVFDRRAKKGAQENVRTRM